MTKPGFLSICIGGALRQVLPLAAHAHHHGVPTHHGNFRERRFGDHVPANRDENVPTHGGELGLEGLRRSFLRTWVAVRCSADAPWPRRLAVLEQEIEENLTRIMTWTVARLGTRK